MTLFELFGKIVIQNSEANKAIDETAEKAKTLGDNLNDAGEQADTSSSKFGENSKFGASAVWLGNTLDRLGQAAFNFAKRGIAEGYEYNKMMESYTSSFKILTGSAETATSLLDDLWILAADTPLEMEGVVKGAEQLLNYGIAVEELIPTLTMLGDASMGNQAKMEGIIRAYGQVHAYGILKAQETNQFIEHGFPLLEFLQITMGQTAEDILAARENGGILFSDVQAAIEYATSEKGRYFESMEEYAKTTEGQEAKFHDNLAQTLGTLMQPFTDEYKDSVLSKLSESLEALGTWASENQESLESLATAIGNVVTGGLDGLVKGLQWITDNKDTVNTALPLIAIGFEALGLAINPIGTLIADIVAGLMWLASGEAGKGVENLANKVTEATGGIVNANALIENTEEDPFFAMNPPPADATADDIKAWFDSVDPELVKEYGIEHPDPSMTNADIEAWWKEVRPTLEIPAIVKVSTFTMPKYSPYSKNNMDLAPGDPSVDALMALHKGDLATYNQMLADGSYVPDGSHKTGLDFVPRDNYIARLHQGEAVLTSEEARAWRNGQNGRQEVYHGESIITGNNFYIQQESDIYDLAVELSSLRRESRRGKGART